MEYKKLDDIAKLIGGYAFKSSKHVSECIRVIRIANVQDGYISDDFPCFYPKSIIEELGDANLNENDLLMSLTGNVGRVGILQKEMLPAGLNQRVECIRPYKEADKKYLFYYFKSNSFIQDALSNSNGIAQLNMSTVWLANKKIPIYSDSKQKEIVSILDKINAIIDADKKQLELLDEAVKSRFIEMFGDPVLNSKKYETIELSSLGYFNRGRSQHRPRNDSILLGGPYPLIQTGEIANADTYVNTYEQTYSEEGLKQSKMWPKGTLCITIAANIAKTAILNIDACFPDSIIGLIPSENVTAIFLHNWFKFFQPILEKQAPAAAQKNLNGTTLGKVQVILPPINEQNKFDYFAELIDKSKFNVQQHLNLMQELLDNKMDEFFGGKE